MDINKIWLSGIVVGSPKSYQLPSGTPSVVFTLKVRETFIDRDGRDCERDSYVLVENLGRCSERALNLARDGHRVMIDGYIRTEGGKIKVRTYTIYPDRSLEALSYQEGLKKAMYIMKESRNIHSALKIIQHLLEDQCKSTTDPTRSQPNQTSP